MYRYVAITEKRIQLTASMKLVFRADNLILFVMFRNYMY